MNRSTSHRWEKSPPNQTLVWRKQAVDFAENSANGQCAMMPDTIWAGDITYIPTDEGWLYLAIVIDWFSRLIVGWSVSDTPDSRLCVQALRLAIHRRKPPADVIPNTAAKPFGMC
ncbi:DDE-type integrase/transposase/recombinase [Mannheimia pernigra]|nr:DDE-type integrase/transposase/recombinase [Mannheimia pernigra]